MSAGVTDNRLSRPASASVLVVDDESCVRELIARWLIADGHACAEAAGLEAAWDQLQAQEFHLVTLDIRMAGGSGLELLHQIAKAFPDTSVIMISAVEEAQSAIEALTYGACAYLVKPIKRDQLIFHTRRALERRQLVVDNRQYLRRLEQRVQEQTVAIRRAHEETIYRLLSASMWRDEETGMHLRRTGLSSELLARAAGWSTAECEDIRLAAPMHDIGKIGIPDAILRKPGKLFLQEFETMKLHTVIGAQHAGGLRSPHAANGPGDRPRSPRALGRRGLSREARRARHPGERPHRGHRRRLRRFDPRPHVPQGTAGRRGPDHHPAGRGAHFDPLLLAVFFAQLPEINRIMEENPDNRGGPSYTILNAPMEPASTMG